MAFVLHERSIPMAKIHGTIMKQKKNVSRKGEHPKSYEELDFTDDFIFCKVLTSDKELCMELLELILGMKVVDIQYLNQQQTMKETYDSKGIRLDVYVENQNDVFNMEMQVEISSELPKRSRYYQDMIDLNLLGVGYDYRELKQSYVIFICIKDVFGENLPVYTFENLCLEKKELSLKDGTQKIFLNASAVDGEYGEKMSPKLRTFLRYLKTKQPSDDFTKRLEAQVKKAKTSAKWRLEYMKLELKMYEMREEGRALGREEGETRKLISQIKKKLFSGKDIEQIAEEVEETVDTIQPIVDILTEHPEYDEDEVCERLR